MSQARQWPKGQNWLIQFMQALIEPSAKEETHFGWLAGVCFGVAGMAMQALLINEIDLFDLRIAAMYDLFLQNAVATATVDMLAFLNGVELYGSLWEHAYLCDTTAPIYQGVAAALPFCLSRDLEKKQHGGVACVSTFTGAYSQADLQLYFKSLRKAADKTPGNKQTISLLLRNLEHALTVGFDPTKNTWYLINANEFPVKHFTSESELAKAVLDAFDFSEQKNESYVTFSTSVYSTKNNLANMQKVMANWKKEPEWLALRNPIYSETWLLLAAMEGDVEAAKRLIDHGVNVNVVHTESGNTPLLLAIREGHDEMAKFLIKNKANVNAEHQGKFTPLYIATAKGNKDIASLLLRHGANPNWTNSECGETALCKAAILNQIDMVKLLIKYGAEPNHAAEDGVTPLAAAVYKKHSKMVKLLMQHGADAYKPGLDGESPMEVAEKRHDEAIEIAEKRQYEAILKLLMQKPSFLTQFSCFSSKKRPLVVEGQPRISHQV